MINGIKENNSGGAMTVLHVLDNKAGVWNQGNRSKAEITANKKYKATDITDRKTALAFAVKMKRALLSIGE
jgi:hypothetical protein